METKTCVKCEKEKPLADFYKTSKNKDLHQSKCKPCHNEQNREYRRRRNKLTKTKPSGYKGYETYTNKEGVTCCRDFDVYGLGIRSTPTITPLRGIEVKERFKLD